MSKIIICLNVSLFKAATPSLITCESKESAIPLKNIFDIEVNKRFYNKQRGDLVILCFHGNVELLLSILVV